MNLKNFKIAIVTPVYEDRESLKMLLEDIEKLTFDVTVFAVDDGSVNKPLQREDISQFRKVSIKIIKLTRNLGHQKAIAVGLNYVYHNYKNEFDFVVTMDSDGEDIPAQISNLIESLLREKKDIAVASRKKRKETISFKIFYFFYKLIFAILTGKKINFGNFIVFQSKLLKRIISMNEIWLHLAASVLLSKLRIAYVPTDRGSRYRDKSKMNFVGLVLHGFRALMVFAEDVLVRIGIFSTFVACLSVIGIIIAFILKFWGNATPGWFSIVVGVLFVVFLLTGILSLISLMLTGVLKNNTVSNRNYEFLIDEVYE
ncbi:glycosyltransferase [Thermodesulfovibrio sp. Kuro-1]|uniref:glycosyltransferase n=1 Tax=Thermodesulfovibrio sp. Kuro-1 TaxID=2580394 RepID=UPI001142A79E|nr:glycosyltransferase [Thermodesulfovibrio sp. Kuro-1]